MKLDIGSYDDAIDALVELGMRPYWASISGRAFFRSIRYRGFRHQKTTQWYVDMISALKLTSKKAVITAREAVKGRTRF